MTSIHGDWAGHQRGDQVRGDLHCRTIVPMVWEAALVVTRMQPIRTSVRRDTRQRNTAQHCACDSHEDNRMTFTGQRWFRLRFKLEAQARESLTAKTHSLALRAIICGTPPSKGRCPIKPGDQTDRISTGISLTKQWSMMGGIVLGTVAGLTMYAFGQQPDAAWTASVVVVCATWWIFEPIPIPVTSLIPLAVFPLVGVLDAGEIGESYGSPLVLLMMGGFMLSVAMERSNTHRRIALTMVNLFGGGGGRTLVFGFMAASAALSMWISNAATTLMLLPIAMAIVRKTKDPALQVSLLLGVAYAASIGGIATPIGTPPNLVFMAVFSRTTGAEPTFTQWMSWSLPIALVMIPVAGLWLTRKVNTTELIDLPDVGRWRSEEIRTLAVFAITALLWMSRKEPFGGWSSWFELEFVNDASVALIAVVVMHLVPSGKEDGSKLLDWESASSIPWGILILYGGGIAIAKAFAASGLSETIGASLTSFSAMPVLMMIGLLCLAVTFLTEVTSNTATATLLMPILASAAMAAEIDPKLIMVPATISCSFAFMLPVATPPNAIVFGSERLTIRQMAREGILLNLIGVAVVTLGCSLMFGV